MVNIIPSFDLFPVLQRPSKSRSKPGWTPEKNHHQYSGDESPYEQYQLYCKHLMHMYRHAHKSDNHMRTSV